MKGKETKRDTSGSIEGNIVAKSDIAWGRRKKTIEGEKDRETLPGPLKGK